MKTDTSQSTFDFYELTGAYGLSIISAAVFFTCYMEGYAMAINGGFETATDYDFLTKATHLTLTTLLAVTIGSIFAFATSLPFFITGILLAKKLKTSSWLYFVSGGVLTSIAACPVFVAIPNLGINMPAFDPSYSEQFFRCLPLFAFCGLVAGSVFWLYCRRKRLLPQKV